MAAANTAAQGDPDDCDTVRDLAQSKIKEVTEKIVRLEAMRAALTQLVAICEGTPSGPEMPAVGRRPPAGADDKD